MADMENYSKRNNVLQHRAQLAFRRIMDDATTDVGLDRVDWLIQQGGDGELAILPAGASERTVAAKLANAPSQVGGLTVKDVNMTDGVKLIFDRQTWLLFRVSGTEPVAQIYAEACSPKDLKNLLDAGKKFISPT